MSPELSELIILCAIGAAVGLVIGLSIRYFKPRGAEAYGQWAARLPWWAYAAFTAMFCAFAALAALVERPYFACFFLGFAALEAAYAIYLLVRSRGRSQA